MFPYKRAYIALLALIAITSYLVESHVPKPYLEGLLTSWGLLSGRCSILTERSLQLYPENIDTPWSFDPVDPFPTHLYQKNITPKDVVVIDGENNGEEILLNEANPHAIFIRKTTISKITGASQFHRVITSHIPEEEDFMAGVNYKLLECE